jgi:hypothetical protein
MVYVLGAVIYFGTAFYALSRSSMRQAGLNVQEESLVVEPAGD